MPEDKDNLKRNAAEALVTKDIFDEKELGKQIETAKNNSVVKSFSYDEADINSKDNDISGVDKSKKTNAENNEFCGEFVCL